MITYCRWPDIWHRVDKYFGRVVRTLGLALLIAVLGGEVGISPPNIAVVMQLTVFGNKIQELLVLHTLSQIISLLEDDGKFSNLCRLSILPFGLLCGNDCWSLPLVTVKTPRTKKAIDFMVSL